MATKRTGYVERYVDVHGRAHYRARIRLADGTRKRLPVPDEKAYSEARAKEWAAAMQEQEDAKGGIFAKKLAREGKTVDGEACDTWFARYFEWCVELGQTSARDKRYRYNVWIKPRIGPKAMVAVTSDDIEDIRDDLDRASREWLKHGRAPGRISGKTAIEVWSVLVSAFREATSSKRRELRIFPRGSRSPCEGVQAPDRGTTRRKPFIYPSEFLALVSCDDERKVPREWRELHAIAAYTYLRPGELRVLRWKDVDLDRLLVSVTKAWDYANGEVKAPKTRNGIRDVPIEPELVPLLRRMRQGRQPDDLVVPILSRVNEDVLADVTRRQLRAAEVQRPALFEDTTTTRSVGFRSWRDTGLTWLAIGGVDIAKMQRRAGHDDISTTLAYVKAAEDLRDTFGNVFPALPITLVASSSGGGDQPTYQPNEVPTEVQVAAILIESQCEGRDLNAQGRGESRSLPKDADGALRQLASSTDAKCAALRSVGRPDQPRKLTSLARGGRRG